MHEKMVSLFINTDVTAVKLYQNYVLAGIGSSVNIYLKDSFKLLDKLNCLRGQKIYGLLPLEDSCNILVFGGKQYTVITLQFLEEGKKDELKLSLVLEAMVCDDWLHSATWLNKVTVALLTAHNTVQIWDVPTQTLKHQYVSSENSILYSGLLLPLQDDILVFAGTVFSEVIIHTPKNEKPLHNLRGHRGVIFSIACLPEKQIIVSTSDDRSVRIWGINLANPSFNLACNSISYWRNVNITCKYEVYGHTARVMRSFITNDLIISVGEDSAICFWNYEGKLLRKNVTHQNSAIWCVDADTSHVVTGGGDGAVILHPIAVAIEYGIQKSVNLNTKTPPIPKKIAFTARKNLIVLDESEDVIHYVNMEDNKTDIFRLDHGLSNKYLSMSSCKQLIAVGNMSGKLDVFAESCKDEQCIINIVSTNLSLGTVLSMQWAGNRNLVFCNGSGAITVLCADKSGVDVCSDFVLPPCKQRWLTAAAMDYKNNVLIVGDRCGNIHVFAKENKNPIKTFNKVHGRYGPTSITIKGDEFITTGRDGTIKYFLLNNEDIGLARYMSSKDLEFQWVEKFIDKEENVICGFKERVFVVYDLRHNLKSIEVPCGGGHRTWDVVRYIAKLRDEYDEFIRLIYVKNNNIFTHTFQMSKVLSRNVIKSSHSKAINCLKSFKSRFDKNFTCFITGGEDTTLRISLLNSAQQFRDEVVFKHLSNVRTLKIFEQEDSMLVVSAGGRAQICVKLINTTNTGSKLKFSSLELISYLIKGTDKERKNNQTWKDYTIDFDPETRIMDLDMLKLEDNTCLIFAGCSDSCLRVFSFNNTPDNVKFVLVREVQYHKTCILKTLCMKSFGKDILITCTTRGEVYLWEVTEMVSWESVKPFFTMRTNKSGINAIAAKIISDDELLIVTGGDDNAIHLTLLEGLDACLSSINVKHSWSTDKFHCSQVTGVLLVEDVLLSTSIDQRVTLSRWSLEDGMSCEFQTQTHSDVADIQGIELLSHSSASTKVCVYGKGVEVIEMHSAPKQ